MNDREEAEHGALDWVYLVDHCPDTPDLDKRLCMMLTSLVYVDQSLSKYTNCSNMDFGGTSRPILEIFDRFLWLCATEWSLCIP